MGINPRLSRFSKSPARMKEHCWASRQWHPQVVSFPGSAWECLTWRLCLHHHGYIKPVSGQSPEKYGLPGGAWEPEENTCHGPGPCQVRASCQSCRHDNSEDSPPHLAIGSPFSLVFNSGDNLSVFLKRRHGPGGAQVRGTQDSNPGELLYSLSHCRFTFHARAPATVNFPYFSALLVWSPLVGLTAPPSPLDNTDGGVQM